MRGCATSLCDLPTGMAPRASLVPPRCPSPGLGVAQGIPGATPRIPQPGAASHCPCGQGEPCEVCPTISEGMLGAIGLPGKPGPRGAPGAPGKDGVSVSLNPGGCGRAGSHLSIPNAPSLFPPPQDRPGPAGPKGDRVGDMGPRGGLPHPQLELEDTEHCPAAAGSTQPSSCVSFPGRSWHPWDEGGKGEHPSLCPISPLGRQPPWPP